MHEIQGSHVSLVTLPRSWPVEGGSRVEALLRVTTPCYARSLFCDIQALHHMVFVVDKTG